MKKYFPVWFKVWFKKGLKIFLSKQKSYRCPICNHRFSSFTRVPDSYFETLDRYQNVNSIFQFETFNFLNYACPVCSSSDRNRLYAIYFERLFSKRSINDSNIKLLDIAPDKNFTSWLKKYFFVDYRSVDLYMKGVDDKADITDMTIYSSNSFDIVLCSHVLEHIKEDNKALLEIYRVLKPGGIAIIMVPILLALADDLENPEWTSEADKWKYYGQNDHVRMYSKKGFVNKLLAVNFNVNQLDINYFGSDKFERCGIHARSVLYTVEK
jgi:predicted SAM-dependent methyltransferase